MAAISYEVQVFDESLASWYFILDCNSQYSAIYYAKHLTVTEGKQVRIERVDRRHNERALRSVIWKNGQEEL